MSEFLFVRSDVDDAGLTPLQFRILGHLSRRAGSDGRITSGIKNMAQTCRICPGTVKKGLSQLRKMNIFKAVRRGFGPSLRFLNPPCDWKIPTLSKSQKAKGEGSNPMPCVGTNIVPMVGSKCEPQRRSLKGNPKKEEMNQPFPFQSDNFKTFWNSWERHLAQLRIHLTAEARSSQLKQCANWGEDYSVQVIEFSVARNYRALYEPATKPRRLGPQTRKQSPERDILAGESVVRIRRIRELLRKPDRSFGEINELIRLAGSLPGHEWGLLELEEKNMLKPFERMLKTEDRENQ